MAGELLVTVPANPPPSTITTPFAALAQPGGTNPRPLGSLGSFAQPTALNIWGDVVGYSFTSTTDPTAPIHGVLYSHGKIIDLGLPKGETAPGYSSYATGINDLRVIVGFSDTVSGDLGFFQQPQSASPNGRGLVYINGQWYDLNDLVNATGKA